MNKSTSVCVKLLNFSDHLPDGNCVVVFGLFVTSWCDVGHNDYGIC